MLERLNIYNNLDCDLLHVNGGITNITHLPVPSVLALIYVPRAALCRHPNYISCLRLKKTRRPILMACVIASS